MLEHELLYYITRSMNDVDDDNDEECEKHLILDKFTLELGFSELRHADRNLSVWQNYEDNGESGQ